MRINAVRICFSLLERKIGYIVTFIMENISNLTLFKWNDKRTYVSA